MAAKLMHAVQYDSYGTVGFKACSSSNPPTPKKNEVLLKLEAASLNPGDCKIQKGLARPLFSRKLPHILVTDVAGDIVEVGEGITKFKVGDNIVAMLSYGVTGAFTKDAEIKLDGTAQQKNILITGASGNIGLYAIQLAKLGNTHVTTTCGARNIELAKSLGADEVLDYKTPEGEAVKSPSGRKYDFVIHSASKAIPWSDFEPNLSSNGKVIDLTPGPSSLFTFVMKKLTFSKMTLVQLIINLKGENLDCFVKLVKEGKLKTVIDSNFPLKQG